MRSSRDVMPPLSYRRQDAEGTSYDVHNFQSSDVVIAVHDLRVRGHVVVRQGGRGRVVGPATSSGRICVQFERREDNSDNRLNCLPDELRLVLVGGHLPGARVRATRLLETATGRDVTTGTPGVVVGPARTGPHDRLVVRFELSALSGLDSNDEIGDVLCEPEDVESAIAGNFRRGNAVIATRDLRVGGQVVVREGVLGTVVGPSSSDSQNRVTVSFSHREDGSRNRLNCIVNELRLYVAGGFEIGSRVQAARTLAYEGDRPLISIGTCGFVLGPAPEDPLTRLLVRFDPPQPQASGGESVSSASSPSPLGSSTPVECDCRADDVTLLLAGGFRRGESVTAAKDLRVKGVTVVKQGIVGTVIGQSSTDPGGRVTVAFARREDGRCNNLNVVPAEIQRAPCTGGLLPGDRVSALRQLLVVPKGTHGCVIGPSCARSSRVAVRFMPVGGEEVVLHVESGDLRVLHAVGDDVDESGMDMTEGEDLTEDTVRPMAAAGGYDRGDTVRASHDLCVNGQVVVRAGVYGTVIGPSGQDPVGRVTVAFAWREDAKTNNLNVVPSEIQQAEPRHIAKGELCAICLGELITDTEDETTGDLPEGETADSDPPPLQEEICHMPCGHILHVACMRAYLKHQTGSNGGPRGPPGNAGAPTGGGSASSQQPPALVPLKPAQCPVCRREMLP
eukprot:TRINITY_DN24379_c0_g1_i2.p1 TRINITY_DN24379_c0_g1~~TRINITY_DN24379_c0_g1_i2.p1  ORF type:complete len:677 (-),score=106.89 TRINITY_DN24379_c0_g1_i2:124-2154(-)